MTASDRWKPIVLLGAVSASLAMLSTEATAQPWAGPERPLADAITQVLRGPFHGGRAPAALELWGQRFNLPAVGSATSLPDHGRLVPVSAPGTPKVPLPLAEDTPSRGKMFLLTALSAAAGYGGTLYWVDRCNEVLPLRPSPPAGNDVLCPTGSAGVMFVTGYLATITATAGAATLAGGGFGKSLAGSALGLAGAYLAMAGAFGTGLDLPIGAVVGVMALAHAGVTTLIAK